MNDINDEDGENLENEQVMEKEEEESSKANNIFESINKIQDKLKRFTLFTNEVQKQYEQTLNTGENNGVKDLDWIRNILKECYQQQKIKNEKKRFLDWLLKILIIKIDPLRSKYNNTTTTEQQQPQNNRISNKIWEYQLQVILRLEYILLKDDLYPLQKFENRESTPEIISHLVEILQDISFLMDSNSVQSNVNNTTTTTTTSYKSTATTIPSLNGKGIVQFLETIILPRYFPNLKKVLLLIYKSLEISKPTQLKKDKSSSGSGSGGNGNILKESKQNINNNNIIISSDEFIKSTLEIDLNLLEDCNDINSNLAKKRKKIEQIQIEKQKTAIENQKNITTIPKDLFKKVNVKKLNHFTMSLSNPEKSFKTI